MSSFVSKHGPLDNRKNTHPTTSSSHNGQQASTSSPQTNDATDQQVHSLALATSASTPAARESHSFITQRRIPRDGPPPSTRTCLLEWKRLTDENIEKWKLPVELPIDWHMPQPDEHETWMGHPPEALFGSNPFAWQGKDESGQLINKSPDVITPGEQRPSRLAFGSDHYDQLAYHPPPTPLAKSSIPHGIPGTHPVVLHSTDCTVVLRVKVEGGMDRVVKLYTKYTLFSGFIQFESERDAYAILQSEHGPICPAVPMCYGWFEIEELSGCSLIWSDETAKLFATWNHGCFGIELDYIEGEPITAETVTIESANAALDAIAALHDCGILHGDPKPEAFLVTESDPSSVVMVGFDFSYAYPHEYANLFTMWRELHNMWTMLFDGMIPDRRIGLPREWYGNIMRYTFDLNRSLRVSNVKD